MRQRRTCGPRESRPDSTHGLIEFKKTRYSDFEP